MNNTSVESWLKDGCGRCDNFKTPACKVHQWHDELIALRKLLQSTGLTEEMKWGSPTWTLDGKNVVMLAAFKDFASLNFFKGAVLKDPEGLLESPGPNSHHARYLKFRSPADVKSRKKGALALLEQAMELERAGVKITPKKTLTLPEELEARLGKDAALKKAFEALTPGRQRSHALYVAGAKQAETRERRVDKCAEDILAGRGFNER
ncbi:MAG: YdeI/OmpD-associated family protein [Myxococcaceae bacterium]